MTEHDEKREAILRAAEQMVQDRRFHEVTLDEVAQAARVGKGTIYNYFRDKDDLFFQLATHGFDELCETIQASVAADAHMPFQERLELMCERISTFFLSRHALFRVMGEHETRLRALHEKNREAFEAQRARLRGAVARVLAVGIPSGLVRTDIPIETQAQFLMALMRMRDHGFGDDPQQMPPLRMVVDLFLHGTRGQGS